MILFRINNRDLSPYVRVQHEEGLDPAAPAYREPVFAGSRAFVEGQRWTADAVGNREIVVPLLLEADDRASLHTLIATIEGELFRGAQVEFGTDSTDALSTFDLERGKIEEEYQYFLSVHSLVRCNLRLWVRPFAHTGTTRLIASVGQVAGSPIGGALRVMPATGLLGDRPALARLGVRVGSTVASGGRVVGFGAHQSASYNPYRGPSGWTGASAVDLMPQASSTVTGASGRLGSQLLSVPVSPTGASGIALTAYLAPVAAHQGRSRVYGVVANGLSLPMAVYAKDRFGAVLGPTQTLSVGDPGQYQLVDLGEVQVPAHASGIGVPTQYVELYGGGASGGGVSASPALRVDSLLFQPLGVAPGLLRTLGAGGDAALYTDTLTRFTPFFIMQLDETLTETGDGTWSKTAGLMGGWSDRIQTGAVAPVNWTGLSQPVANASAFYSLASGVRLTDIAHKVKLQMSSGEAGSVIASAHVGSVGAEVWVKQINASQGMYSRLDVRADGSVMLRLIAATGAATIVLASAAGAAISAAATGLFAGRPIYMETRALGPQLTAWVGTSVTGLGAASVTASNAMTSFTGWPGIKLNSGASVASSVITLEESVVSRLGAGGSDMGPREYFRFESWPERRAYQGNASIFLADRAAAFRGQHPQLPRTGSPAASGGGRLMVFSGVLDNFIGNDPIDVEVEALERFTFLR